MQKHPDDAHSRIWSKVLFLIFALVVTNTLIRFLASTIESLHLFWGRWLHWIPVPAGLPRNVIEFAVALTLSLILTWIALSLGAWVLRRRQLKQVEELRENIFVFIPRALGRYELGYVTKEDEFRLLEKEPVKVHLLAREKESTAVHPFVRAIIRSFSIFTPSFPALPAGAFAFVVPSVILKVHNPFEDIAKFLLKIGKHFVGWEITDIDGNPFPEDATMIIPPAAARDLLFEMRRWQEDENPLS